MRAGRRDWKRIFVLIVAALAAFACAKIVGRDRYEIDVLTLDAGDAGICREGQFHCEGAALQLCKSDLSGFRTAQVCATSELCCDEIEGDCARVGCRVPACAPGDYRCVGPELQSCNEGLTDWTRIDTCASPVQCSAALGRCTETPCNSAAPNPDFQCNGPVLEQCGASQWMPVETCESRSLCSTGGTTERGCQPNGCLVEVDREQRLSGFECANADLRRCNAGQTGYEYVETCINAANCLALLGMAPGALSTEDLAEFGCTTPSCVAGTYQCNGTTLSLCDPNRLAYDEQEECTSPSHCNASLGRCEAQPCVPGTRQCSAGELWLCTPEQTWTTERECGTGFRCDVSAQACVPKVCDSGEYQCEANLLQRCNVDGSGWIPVHTCATNELCNPATKRCERPKCEPNQRRCTPEGKLQACSPGLDAWQDVQDCAATADPPVALDAPVLTGVCDPRTGCLPQPSCVAGERRCNGQLLERCDGGTRWRPQERCLTANLCDPTGMGSCRPAACQPGEYRCVMTAAIPVVFEPDTDVLNLTLQQCNTSGTAFERVQDCIGTYCDATHGQCDLCDAYETLCEGDTLKRCSADGQEKELEKNCSQGCVTNPGADAGAGSALGSAICIEDVRAP